MESNKKPAQSSEMMIEYWNDDDIKELREELNIETKQRYTDFSGTMNVWDNEYN